MKLSEAELQELAAHLQCPDGDNGSKVAEMMNSTNANIINKTIAALQLQDEDNVLEIGPGNGRHVNGIKHKIIYKGIDISGTMVAEANKAFDADSSVFFYLSDGENIPFEDESFTKVFTVNTIYFWKHPSKYAAEIARVLKSGGWLSVGYIPKRAMEKIPFARYGFTLYDEAMVKEILHASGFKIISEITEQEFVTSNSGGQIVREFVVVTAEKL